MIKPKFVLLTFVSGKIVLTGAKFSGRGMNPFAHLSLPSVWHQVREEIYTAFNTIYTVLCKFRKP